MLAEPHKIYSKLQNIAKKNIPLVEDNAQGTLSNLKDEFLGTIGDFAGFSFQTTKVVASGEGGAISCKERRPGESEKFISLVKMINHYFLDISRGIIN